MHRETIQASTSRLDGAHSTYTNGPVSNRCIGGPRTWLINTRDYEDNRGRSRRDWNERANDERRARFGNDEPRRFGDERFGDKRQRFGDYERQPYQSSPRDDFWRGEEPEAWRHGEGDSFGGQRPYARDLYLGFRP